ncbi:MAG: lasso peptide biosynthesis B2 protein [Gemmatimonadales bacterium]
MITDLIGGAVAALRAPSWLSAAGIRELQNSPALTAAPPLERAELRLRASGRAIRLLSRLPGSPWRNTCLYRSVAATLALRSLGYEAVLRLGVSASGGPIDVAAHAWVECPGVQSRALPAEGLGGFVPLR